MKYTAYKAYTIQVVGLSHSIFRPGQLGESYAPGYAQSMAGARRWVNEDINAAADRMVAEGKPFDDFREFRTGGAR